MKHRGKEFKEHEKNSGKLEEEYKKAGLQKPIISETKQKILRYTQDSNWHTTTHQREYWNPFCESILTITLNNKTTYFSFIGIYFPNEDDSVNKILGIFNTNNGTSKRKN